MRVNKHFGMINIRKDNMKLLLKGGLILFFILLQSFSISSYASEQPKKNFGVAIGSQYDSTHVYVTPSALDAFVNSFVATFGGQASKPVVANVTPENSSTT